MRPDCATISDSRWTFSGLALRSSYSIPSSSRRRQSPPNAPPRWCRRGRGGPSCACARSRGERRSICPSRCGRRRPGNPRCDGAVGGHNLHGQVVDVVELGELRLRGARHAAELGEGAEERLVRHRGDGDRLVLDGEALLGLHSLVKAVGPAAADHGAAGELVDDDNLVPLDDVVDILELQVLRLDGVDDVERPLEPGVVKIGHLQELLRSLVALLREQDGLLLLVNLVVVILLERVRDLSGLNVTLGGFISDAGDDQRGSRFVDEDGINLVDHAKVKIPKHELSRRLREVIAKVIESELRVGDVRDVCVVTLATLSLGHARLDQSALQAEELMNLANHPSASSEIIIHRHDVHALPAERVEERGRADTTSFPHQCASPRCCPRGGSCRR